MAHPHKTRRQSRVLSPWRILLFAVVSSWLVLAVSLAIQWLIYNDWLHETGPLRIVGTTVAAGLTFAFVYRWLLTLREHDQDMLRRFDTIAKMNDRIRNALQVIECTTFAVAPEATDHVKSAVAVIDEALRGVVAETGIPPGSTAQKKDAVAGSQVGAKTAKSSSH